MIIFYIGYKDSLCCKSWFMTTLCCTGAAREEFLMFSLLGEPNGLHIKKWIGRSHYSISYNNIVHISIQI